MPDTVLELFVLFAMILHVFGGSCARRVSRKPVRHTRHMRCVLRLSLKTSNAPHETTKNMPKLHLEAKAAPLKFNCTTTTTTTD
jgi:hypothetical protein